MANLTNDELIDLLFCKYECAFNLGSDIEIKEFIREFLRMALKLGAFDDDRSRRPEVDKRTQTPQSKNSNKNENDRRM